MFEALLPTAGWYTLFSFFVFNQQLHAKDFQGGSQTFGLLLAVFGFAGLLVGLAYLGTLGYQAAWWAPFPVLILGTLVAGIGSALFARSRAQLAVLSLIAFAAWPLAAYMMFRSIPA